MIIIDPGHKFSLNILDGIGSETLTFVKREGHGYPGNVGHYPGTNMQEVIRAIMSRVKYLDNQESHEGNIIVLNGLRDALWALEQRAAERHGRVLCPLLRNTIESLPTCRLCGHVGCIEECRRA